jgi:hypothetical protein
MQLTVPQAEFVERVGRYWEGWGQPRTAGRILGWLMICDPPEQSSSALAVVLSVSAGSVSTTTRQLHQMGLIDRVTFPGDRVSYFRLHDHVWLRVMEVRLEGIRGLHALAQAGAEVRPTMRPDRVDELLDMTEFMLEEWPKLMERLPAHVGSRGAHQ